MMYLKVIGAKQQGIKRVITLRYLGGQKPRAIPGTVQRVGIERQKLFVSRAITNKNAQK